MTEIERIHNNVNGELPKEGKYKYIIIQNISNGEHELEIFKKSIIVFLENQHLHEEDPKWENLLPKAVVSFTKQLEEKDYHNDDLVSHIPSIINGLRKLREWEWYSSQLFEDGGFEVVVKGNLIGIATLNLLHHQGLPHKAIYTGTDKEIYPVKALTDVLTYKKWDSKTLKLK